MDINSAADAVIAAAARAAGSMAAWRMVARVRLARAGHKGATGVVLYEGPSQLPGQSGNIVVIATGTRRPSQNEKTGDMLQVWIMAQGEEPTAAIKSGADSAVCGGCKHRRGQGGGCYVVPHQGPLTVYRSWAKGRYPKLTEAATRRLLAGAHIRFGAYGDPAAVPPHILVPLMAGAKRRTGYTHQWHKAGVEVESVGWLKPWIMASADTPGEVALAHSLGWRTFRTTLPGEAGLPGEVVCLADSEARPCAACGLCNGGDRGKNIRIEVHGGAGMPQRYAAQRAGGAQ